MTDIKTPSCITRKPVTRRNIIKAAIGLSAFASLPVKAVQKPTQAHNRFVNLVNLHTGEQLHTHFMEGGIIVPDAMTDLSKLLRDHRNDKTHIIDQNLLSMLHRLQTVFQPKEPIQVLSAYRSPETNEKLRAQGHRVARKSYHLKGRAIDIRIPGIDLKQLHRAALGMQDGGVGLYSRSQFVHMDTGPVRRWGN